MFQGSYSLQFHFLIPGSEIPKWFSHQSEGTSLNLQGPSDFMGMAMCAVFVLRQHRSPQYHHIYFYCDVIGTKISENLNIGFSEEFGKIDSYHLWMKYFPFKGKWQKELNEIDANGSSQIVVKFETFSPGLEVMKCGARLVYKQDIEDLKQTMAWNSKCSITPYEGDLDDSAKDTKIKQSRDDSMGTGRDLVEKVPLMKSTNHTQSGYNTLI